MLLGSREENAGTKRIPDAVLSLFPWAQRSEQENVINVERKVGYPGIEILPPGNAAINIRNLNVKNCIVIRKIEYSLATLDP